MFSTKTDITNGIETSFERFAQHIAQLNKQHFEECPEGKWSAGQQLDHLIRSVQPLNLAFILPKFIFPLLYDKTKRKSLTYEELLKKYSSALANGGTASRRYVPPVIFFEQKQEKIKIYLKEKEKLQKNLQPFTEKQLDNILLPHPLLGKLTVREMLFFTIFHTEHHLKNIEKIKTL